MSDEVHSIKDQFILLSREIRHADAAMAEKSTPQAQGMELDGGGAYDEVDVDIQRRYSIKLREEFAALKHNNVSALSNTDELESLSKEDAPDVNLETMDVGGREGSLALVIGHSPQGDKGNNGSAPPFPAEPRTARSEYYWNRDLAERIKSVGIERGYDVEIFHRWKSGARHIPEAYIPVRAWQPEATIEIHFNGYKPRPIIGTETLYLRGNSNSQKWSQALQDQMVALYGRQKSDKSDRGLKPKVRGENGAISLRQIQPCALIEPFFGDSPVDAALGTGKKQLLAIAIMDAFATQSAHTPVSAAEPVEGGSVDTVVSGITLTPEFDELRKLYATIPIDFPALRDITFAQWAHESDFGRSELATKYSNFGGMKWLSAMAPLAKPVPYRPSHDPDGRDYCGFDSFENFIAGYFHRLDLPSLPYSSRNGGWRNHAENPNMFIDFIGPIWAPRGGSNSRYNIGYEDKVRKRLDQLQSVGMLPSIVANNVITVQEGIAISDDLTPEEINAQSTDLQKLSIEEAITTEDIGAQPGPEDFVEDFDEPQIKAAAANLSRVKWPAMDKDAPDYAYIANEPDPHSFTLTPDTLEKLIELNRYKPYRDKHTIAFALRGAQIVGGHEVEESDSVSLENVRPDHRNFRCVIGYYFTDTQKLTAYTGSTVPCRLAVWSYKNGGDPSNMLPTGLHTFYNWRHKQIKPALRMGYSKTDPESGAKATVLRNKNDYLLSTLDAFSLSTPYDNIHCSYYLYENNRLGAYFSSWGCLTVRGQNPPTDQWKKFQATLDKLGSKEQVDLILATGKDAALITASDQDISALSSKMTALRRGSRGEEVKRLQAQTGAQITGFFGAETLDKFTTAQRSFNQSSGSGRVADGIYTLELEAATGWNIFNAVSPNA